MEALQPLIDQYADTFVFGAVVLIVLRWAVNKIDGMIGTLNTALARAGEQLAEEQKAHAAIMQALTEITGTQVRITEALVRIEQRMAAFERTPRT